MESYGTMTWNTKTTMASSVLRGFLSYVSRLYSDGEISEKTYKFLVKQALAEFIEDAVEQRVEHVVEVGFTNFIDKAVSRIH